MVSGSQVCCDWTAWGAFRITIIPYTNGAEAWDGWCLLACQAEIWLQKLGCFDPHNAHIRGVDHQFAAPEIPAEAAVAKPKAVANPAGLIQWPLLDYLNN